jgi:REP element-mobilizing transposase RayT
MAPILHNRRSIRLRGYDYRRPGAYFITLCVKNRESLFGDIRNGEMVLNEMGRVVADEWMRTPKIRSEIQLDALVVMPKHIIGMVVIIVEEIGSPVGATRRAAPTVARSGVTNGPVSGSIGAIIGQFKSITTKRINAMRQTPGFPIWQRNYYEHIVRRETDLIRIREYIVANPANWERDVNFDPVFLD